MNLDTPIVWVPDFAVGIPLVDAQHFRLVEMAENLRQSIVDGHASTSTKILKGLISYCAEHFECEEMVMESVGFPTFSGHCAIHREFTDKVLKWFDEFQKGQLEPTIVLEALVQWLIHHILNQDAKIALHCQENNIDTSKYNSVSDLIRPEKSHWVENIPVELGLLFFVLPMLGVLCWLTFGRHGAAEDLTVFGIGLAINVVVSLLMIYFVRQTVHRQIRGLQLAHARQLADNMLASDIAKRVAVLDLDDIDSLLTNEASSLVMALQEIVEHVKLYLPYIPDTVLALIRGEGGQDDEVVSCPSIHSALPTAKSTASYPDLHTVRGTNSNDNLPAIAKKASKYNSSPVFEQSHSDLDEVTPSIGKSGGGTVHFSQATIPGPAATSGAKYEHLDVAAKRKMSRVSGQSIQSVQSTYDKNNTLTKDRRVSRMSAASTVRGAGTSSKMKQLGTTWLMKKIISSMAVDITGFNTFATMLNAEDLLRIHSHYVTVINDVSKATRGKVNWMVGDRLFLSWNAASPVGNYAQQACKAALQLRETLAKDASFKVVKSKIAVATGTALVGNVGSKSNLSFAIVGPVSIITSALCKLNAVLSTTILICSNTYRNAKQFYIAKTLVRFDLYTSPLDHPSIPLLPACKSGVELKATPSRVSLHPTTSHPAPVPVAIAAPAPEDEVTQIEVITLDSDGNSARGQPKPDPASPRRATLGSSHAENPELRRMTAMELVSAFGTAAEDEWMYQLQNATNPFEGYNEAVQALFFGDHPKGIKGLREYTEEYPADGFAQKMLRDFESKNAHLQQQHSNYSWLYGWHNVSPA